MNKIVIRPHLTIFEWHKRFVWCNKRHGLKNWQCYRGDDGDEFLFEKEEDATLFALRWAE